MDALWPEIRKAGNGNSFILLTRDYGSREERKQNSRSIWHPGRGVTRLRLLKGGPSATSLTTPCRTGATQLEEKNRLADARRRIGSELLASKRSPKLSYFFLRTTRFDDGGCCLTKRRRATRTWQFLQGKRSGTPPTVTNELSFWRDELECQAKDFHPREEGNFRRKLSQDVFTKRGLLKAKTKEKRHRKQWA